MPTPPCLVCDEQIAHLPLNLLGHLGHAARVRLRGGNEAGRAGGPVGGSRASRREVASAPTGDHIAGGVLAWTGALRNRPSSRIQ